jgi:transposase
MSEYYQQAQKDNDLIVLWGDSAEVSLLPTITRCWTRIGQQRIIPTPGVRAAKCWNWGVVDVVSGRTLSLLHPRRNNIGLRRLLAAIARHYELGQHPQRQVILWLDNDRAHKARAVERLLSKHNYQIRIEWLPAYSPELNPQEDIWRHLRRRVTHNFYFGHMDRLQQAVRDFHQELEHTPESVLQLISKWTHLIAG